MAASDTLVTYATISAEDESLHAAYEQGVRLARTRLGRSHGFRIGGEERSSGRMRTERSPIDRDLVIGEFAQAGPGEVDEAVGAARTYFPRWAATSWKERVAVLRRVAGLIEERRFELAAALSLEVGKNRLEALGDVQESADLIDYYCREMERHEGFRLPMGRLSPEEKTLDVMRPYGVWAVVAPFNFPLALAAGPVGAALVAGNTVVLKPASVGSWTSLLLADAFADAGLPPDALHVLTGAGGEVGTALVGHPGVAGVTFTGSAEVGMEIYRSTTGEPKPVICEMGGKNPVIIARDADLDAAVQGTVRSAFGFGGQKCSAASRALVARPLYDSFLEMVVGATEKLVVGNPLERATDVGPLIDERAVARYEEAVGEAGARGRVLTGGRRLLEGALARGNYVQAAVVEAPDESWIWKRELFAPVLAVTAVDSLEEALTKANDTEYGLTAGFFGNDPAQIDEFLDGIHAGVVYVNRRAGATTGAWPAVQPFGGWKGSGTGGKSAGGPYYLPLYLREQSRTVIAA